MKSILIEAGHPFPVRLLGDVRNHSRLARIGDPAGDALPHPHLHHADHVLVQAVGGREQQLAARWGHKVEGADVRADGGGRLPDDQLQKLVRALGGGCGLGQADEEVELPGGEARVRQPARHLHVRQATSRLHARSRVNSTMDNALHSVTDTDWFFGRWALG